MASGLVFFKFCFETLTRARIWPCLHTWAVGLPLIPLPPLADLVCYIASRSTSPLPYTDQVPQSQPIGSNCYFHSPFSRYRTSRQYRKRWQYDSNISLAVLSLESCYTTSSKEFNWQSLVSTAFQRLCVISLWPYFASESDRDWIERLTEVKMLHCAVALLDCERTFYVCLCQCLNNCIRCCDSILRLPSQCYGIVYEVRVCRDRPVVINITMSLHDGDGSGF